MINMELKKYEEHTTKTGNLTGTIKSGVKSGNSDVEMMIVEPLIKHPEIEGIYRAVDPDTGWKGWVEYKPPVEEVEVAPKEEKINQLNDLRREFRQKKELVDEGNFSATELGLPALRNEIKTLYLEINS